MEPISPRAALAVLLLACAVLAAPSAAALPAANATLTSPDGLPTAVPTTPTPIPTPVPTVTSAPLTLVVEQERTPAIWGDTVGFAGTGAGSATVRLLVDGVRVGSAAPDARGDFRFDYVIDRLPEGTHIVAAETGPLAGAEASLEVGTVESAVMLAAVPTVWENETAVLCTGNVTAGGRAVPEAAVRLVFDRTAVANVTTGPEGQFELLAGISGGTHEVVANVSFDDGRPIGPSSSAVVRVELPGSFPVLPVLGFVAVVLLAGAGAYVLRRRSRADRPPWPRPAAVRAGEPVHTPTRPVPAAPPAPPATPEAVPSPAEELRATALRIAGDGGREGVEAVYHALVSRLAAREPGTRLASMTPREVTAHFARAPGGVAVARVAACYEAVVYSGREPTPVDVETVVEGFVAALSETARAGR